MDETENYTFVSVSKKPYAYILDSLFLNQIELG